MSGHSPDELRADNARLRLENETLRVRLAQTRETPGLGVPLRDIDDRRKAEDALVESEERYRHLFENLCEGFALHEMLLDAKGEPQDYRFLEVNHKFEEMTGLSKERILGHRVREVLPEIEQFWIEKYGSVVRTGEPLQFENYARALGRDYQVIAFRPRPGQFATLLFDVTERKRLERLYAVLIRVNEAIVRTRNEETLFRDVCQIVVEEGKFPLVWIGLVTDRRVIPVAGYGPESDYLDGIQVEIDGSFGQGPTGTCIREDRPIVNDDFDTNPITQLWRESALAHGIRASAAFPLHRDGKPIGAFTLYAQRRGAFDTAQVKLLESLCADISYALVAIDHERKRNETETVLREADRLKNEFLALLSHELRNPLAPIKNSLFILERSAPGSEQAKRSLAVIDRQTAQLTRLVDDLLDITRITRNKIQLQLHKLELNELVRLTIEDHRAVFANAGVRLHLQLCPDRVFVNADANRLTQVIGNLLHNAAKFTDCGGSAHISVGIDAEQKLALVRVVDTGVGITSEVLGRLFEPFMQADQTLDRSRGGLGLGLALVKGLIELHGGHVHASSAGLGTGSTFEVRLPVVAEESQTIKPAESAANTRRRILIIEDNIDAAETLREALEFCGHDVDVAYSGHAGIERAREFRPEVVLCDIGLPGMSGYEVAHALRADERTFNAPFLVALSGYAQPEDSRRAIESGFDQHLAKPPSLEKIEEVLRRVPSMRSAH